MIKIKLSVQNYSPEVREEFLRQTPGKSGVVGGVKFFINEEIEDCDYWVVVDSLPGKERSLCSKENVILLTGEPTSIKEYDSGFLKQFAKVITAQDNLKHKSVYKMPTGHGWWPKKSFDELYGHNDLEKDKLISIVVSNKAYTPGHKKRLDFCLKLKEHFGDKIDLFGRGINPFEDKWDVLAPYKYAVVIENSSEPNYISEKLTDCFVCLTFPFYYGCPNAHKFYGPDSLQYIDIEDFEKSCRTIEGILEDESHYENHLGNLVSAKNKYLTELHFFPLIAEIIKKEYGNAVNNPKEIVTLKPEKDFQKVKYAILGIKKFLIKFKNKLK